MPFFPSLPDNASTAEIFAAHPDIYRSWGDVSHAVLRGPSPLTPGERELIGAFVSGINSCDYCAGGHRAAAEAFGIDHGVFQALMQDIASAPVSDRLKPLLAYVQKLTKTASRMVQADADAVFAAGWDEQALHDAIAVCCVFNFMNRLVQGHGIEADPAKFFERGQRHVQRGYQRR